MLTVALPTYNRAELLERQLEWLAGELSADAGASCEVLISDNCSTDETPGVIERWASRFGDAVVRTRRHRENIGPIRNIASGIEDAAGRFVWTISDDDPIHVGTVAYLLRLLSTTADLQLVVLNFSMRHVETGQLMYDRCFDMPEQTAVANGRGIFEELLTPRHPARWGGLVLTSALVYRSETARGALAWWPAGTENLNMQLVLTAYCAAAGPTVVTADTHLECAGGEHHFTKNDQRFFKFVVQDYAETFVKLTELGYDTRLCRRKILEQPTYVSRRLTARCAVRYPWFTARTVCRYLRALWRSHQRARATS